MYIYIYIYIYIQSALHRKAVIYRRSVIYKIGFLRQATPIQNDMLLRMSEVGIFEQVGWLPAGCWLAGRWLASWLACMDNKNP